MTGYDQSDDYVAAAWARICAFVWTEKNPKYNILDLLRKDPKQTVEIIAQGEKGEYKADLATATAAQKIMENSQDPKGYYSGYLPVPEALKGLDVLDETILEKLFEEGITGVLRFDDQSQLWAKVFLAAWQDEKVLYDIRKDPVPGLKKVLGDADFNKLKSSKYGILPIPDLPSKLNSGLTIQQLEIIGADTKNLSGIVPLACF